MASLATAAAQVLLDPVLSLVFPSACPCCGRPLERPSRGPLCGACWDALPRHAAGQCSCGFPLPVPAAEACGRCRRGLGEWRAGASLGPYDGALREAILQLKFVGRRRVATRLAAAMLATPACRRVLAADAVLVPVALHPARLTARGYNQSALLARALARAADAPVVDALRRIRDTPPQTGLSAAARRRNVAGAFRAVGGAVAGRHVVLVDDVMTTGATARAAAAALRRAGARSVSVLTAARVA